MLLRVYAVDCTFLIFEFCMITISEGQKQVSPSGAYALTDSIHVCISPRIPYSFGNYPATSTGYKKFQMFDVLWPLVFT